MIERGALASDKLHSLLKCYQKTSGSQLFNEEIRWAQCLLTPDIEGAAEYQAERARLCAELNKKMGLSKFPKTENPEERRKVLAKQSRELRESW